MHTHQIPPGCSLLGRTRPRRRPSGGFRRACRHTHMHTRQRRSERLLHKQTSTYTSALHPHGWRACAGLLCSRPGHLRPTCSRLDGRVAPRRAARLAATTAPLRRCRRRRRRLRCRRGRRTARLCARHARRRRSGTCENRSEAPMAAPPRSRTVHGGGRRPGAPSGAAREAGWWRADVDGWQSSRADAVQDDPARLSKP